ncbi:MAG: DUF2231 domain-containing protein [Balneolaceae bacterium]
MFKELFRGRFKGHPIHVMFVHFPIGLFSAGFCIDLAAFWIDETHLPFVSFYCMAGGVAGAIAAITFGLIDYIKLAENEQLFKKAGKHAVLQLTSVVLFGTVFGLKISEFPVVSDPTIVMLVVEAIAFSVMIAGNFIGGDLVYSDGVGTKEI